MTRGILVWVLGLLLAAAGVGAWVFKDRLFPREGEAYYVVRKGDTFATISKRCYGREDQWKLLAEANPGTDPVRMKVGGSLRIPPAPVPEASTPLQPTPTPKVSLPSKRTCVVRKGDTLSGIARRFYGHAEAWSLIAKANPGVDPDRLPVGATLKLPPVPNPPAPWEGKP